MSKIVTLPNGAKIVDLPNRADSPQSPIFLHYLSQALRTIGYMRGYQKRIILVLEEGEHRNER